MRYIVFGAGAVGGVVGGRLHAAGHDVVLLARGPHLDALRRDGLHLLTPDGPEHHRIPTAADPAEAQVTDDDVVLLTVKSQDTADALTDLRLQAPGATVVCAQNGIANEREALRRFADVHAMCVILPSQFVEPGVVVQQSAPSAGVLDVGRYPSGTDATDEALAAALTASGFRAAADPDVMRKKHRKLLLNLGNALDALCGWEARASDLYKEAQAEAERCLAAAGLAVQSAEEEHQRRDGGVTLRPVEGQDRGGSSTWQSLARGTGTIETDFLNGEVVLLGRLHGIDTPVNALLQREAARAAHERRSPGTTDLADLEAQLRR